MAFAIKCLAVMTAVVPMASVAHSQETIGGIDATTVTANWTAPILVFGTRMIGVSGTSRSRVSPRLGPGRSPAILGLGETELHKKWRCPTKVVTGFEFAEGPASDREGNLYFTDFPKNRIYKFSRSGKLSVFVEHSRQANGLMVNGGGELVACQMDGRVVAYSLQDPKAMRIVASEYNKHAFNAPNDLVIDAIGGVYFTDPPLENTPLRQDRVAVYYAAADGTVSRLIDDLEFPNGVILSPDEKTLYVINSKSPNVMSYPVLAPGRIGKASVFCELKQKPQANMPGGDGVTVDCKGNLYVASPPGVQVFNPGGKSLGIISVPEQAYNVTFGGPEQSRLIIAAESSVYAIQMETNWTAPLSSSYKPEAQASESLTQNTLACASGLYRRKFHEKSRSPAKGHTFPAAGQEYSKRDTK